MKEECQNQLSQIFVQVGCTLASEGVADRQIQGLALGCAAVFIALFVLNFVDYIKQVQINEYVEWDVKTITAADYTIEFDIKPDFYEAFLELEHQGFKAKQAEQGVTYQTPQEAFKDWISESMERRLD
jgi:hypothetical protein